VFSDLISTRLHARTSTGAASLPERRLHGLLREAGLGGWRAGARIWDDEGLIGVVDLVFDQAKAEVDGLVARSGRDAFVTDRRRQNRLVRAGCTVLRFSWWDLAQDPAGVVRTIRQVTSSSRG
jgi:very-short-patch-repair endonuclease